MATTQSTATCDFHQWGYLRQSIYVLETVHIEIQTVFMETNKRNTLSVTKFFHNKIMCILKAA